MLKFGNLFNPLRNIHTYKRFFNTFVDTKIRDKIPLNLTLPDDVAQLLIQHNYNYLYPCQYLIISNFTKHQRTIFYGKPGIGKTIGFIISLVKKDLDRPAVVATASDHESNNLARLLLKLSPTIKIHLSQSATGFYTQNNKQDYSGNIVIGTLPKLINYIQAADLPSFIVYDDIQIAINNSLMQKVDHFAQFRRIIYERFTDKPIEIAITSEINENVTSYFNEKLTGFYQFNLDQGTSELVSGNVNNDAISLKAEFGRDFEIDTIFSKYNPKNVEHLVCKSSAVGLGHKLHLIYHLIRLYSGKFKCLVYVKNRHQARMIANRFSNACRLGRDLSKSARGSMLEDFINGNKNIFIATSTKYSKQLSRVSQYIINLSPFTPAIYKSRTNNFKGKIITFYDKREYPMVVDLIREMKKTFKVYVAPTNAEIEKLSFETLTKELVANVKNVDKNPFYTQVANELVDKHGPLVLASLFNRLAN